MCYKCICVLIHSMLSLRNLNYFTHHLMLPINPSKKNIECKGLKIFLVIFNVKAKINVSTTYFLLKQILKKHP